MIAKFDKWRWPAAILVVYLATVGAVAVSAQPFDSGSHSAHLLRIRDDHHSISVDDASNGSTIQASPGQTIELTLNSTSWKIEPSSNPSIVAMVAEPSVTSAGPRACPPGVGCGGVHAVFEARAPGTASISASRSVCGEVLPCRPNQRFFKVTIVVR